MEWLTIALAALLTILSPAGLIIDKVVASRIRASVEDVEKLAVRIDNVPTHQILGGKVDRIRIATRGVYPIANVRIEAIEIETEGLNVNLESLTQRGNRDLGKSLKQPAQIALRVVIKEADVNQALSSPEIKTQIEKLINKLVSNQAQLETQFELSKIRLEFLANNRIRAEIQLQTPKGENETEPAKATDLVLETGINVIKGRTIQIIEPTASLNGRKLSTRLLQGFAEGLNEQLDLQILEKENIIARILQLNITEEEINLASFIRVNPESNTEKTQQ